MKQWKKCSALFLALVMLLALAIPAGAVSPQEDLSGHTIILHTNDVHGGIAGYAAVAGLKQAYQAAGAGVLLADAGDFAQGDPTVSVSQGATAVELMNLAGYDVAAPGNHEFDYGYDNLKTLASQADFPILAADVLQGEDLALEGGTAIFQPLGESGPTIGIFGLATPETATKAHPDKIKGLTFLSGDEMFACAQAQVDDLKAQGCDYILCLGHLGIDPSSQGNRSIDLLEHVTGIDVFLDGHSHSTLADILSVTDGTGKVWRLTPFIENTDCFQSATPELFEASARSFGNFQHMLQNYPAETLHETIVNFHNTEDRYAKFEAALAADKLGRAAGIAEEIQFVQDRKADCSVALDALRSGKLPLRVTHNDTKLNNILIDRATGKGICVIDLDTTMPGLSINDFGDSIRFGANHAKEDEKDLSKVNFDIDLYEVYTRGFLEGAQGSLTPAELEYLPWGARLMTLECGIRFLTDYLDGDHYFRIHRPEHNLDRCRTQFKLVRDMEEQFDAMAAVVAKYAR